MICLNICNFVSITQKCRWHCSKDAIKRFSINQSCYFGCVYQIAGFKFENENKSRKSQKHLSIRTKLNCIIPVLVMKNNRINLFSTFAPNLFSSLLEVEAGQLTRTLFVQRRKQAKKKCGINFSEASKKSLEKLHKASVVGGLKIESGAIKIYKLFGIDHISYSRVLHWKHSSWDVHLYVIILITSLFQF